MQIRYVGVASMSPGHCEDLWKAKLPYRQLNNLSCQNGNLAAHIPNWQKDQWLLRRRNPRIQFRGPRENVCRSRRICRDDRQRIRDNKREVIKLMVCTANEAVFPLHRGILPKHSTSRLFRVPISLSECMLDFAMCYEETKGVFEIARGFLAVVIMDMAGYRITPVLVFWT